MTSGRLYDEVLVLREVLFKRSQYDTLDKHYIELNVLLKDTFFKVKKKLCRRLKARRCKLKR